MGKYWNNAKFLFRQYTLSYNLGYAEIFYFNSGIIYPHFVNC